MAARLARRRRTGRDQRAIVYERRIGSTAAHYLSTANLLGLLTGYMFEFGFGHFVARESWSALLEQYNVTGARVWILVPAWMAIGPYILRSRR
jgi:hypothetical protein